MEFRRIQNLPPYVFTIINDLKIAGAKHEHPDQQKKLGAGLASFFNRNRQTAAPQQQQQHTAAPKQVAEAPSRPAASDSTQSAPNLLAGLRKAWTKPSDESAEQKDDGHPSAVAQTGLPSRTDLVERALRSQLAHPGKHRPPHAAAFEAERTECRARVTIGVGDKLAWR